MCQGFTRLPFLGTPCMVLNFVAEVKQVASKKTASLDIEYTVKLVTNDPAILSLGTLQADELVQVEVSSGQD